MVNHPNRSKASAFEIIPRDGGEFDGALVGGGLIRKGPITYRVMLRAGHPPQCSINGELYDINQPGDVDCVLWKLLVDVRSHFNA